MIQNTVITRVVKDLVMFRLGEEDFVESLKDKNVP